MFNRTKKNNNGDNSTSTKTQQVSDLVIVDEKVVSVSDLQAGFKSASTKFWCLLISFALLATMIIPYMSNAATMSSSATSVFDGNVIPGYSMGGVTLTAYGVDLNDWANPSDGSGTIVRTNYGIWNENTVTTTKASALGADVDAADGEDDASETLDSDERSSGWKLITGRTNYSLSNPNGQSTSSNSNSSDSVAPYRTTADYNFWSSKTPTSDSNASADIDVSLYADFIIVSLDSDGNLSLISNPDDVTDSNETGTVEGTTAEPYYISLKDMLNAYGLNSTNASSTNAATMDNLIAAVEEDGGQKIVDLINDGASLLEGTYYEVLNANESSLEDSDKPNASTQAFNPYPYTMVFSATDSDGNIVVSSIYENCEAYVFFSPASVYSKYTTLRSEYDDYVSGLTDSQLTDAGVIFQLGYYAATLAILEAYLDEALPQDATRGYVGPTENYSVYDKEAGELDTSTVTRVIGDDLESASSFQTVLYGTLMYDVAKTVVLKGATGEAYEFGKTNAIMDLLSTFGYNNNLEISTGIMKGMPRDYVYARSTSLTVTYDTTTAAANQVNNVGKDKTDRQYLSVNAGMYTPVYYPIQQHVMPESEKTYRFQILSSVPYETLVKLIGTFGMSSSVELSYSSSIDELGIDLENIVAITTSLVSQFSDGFSEDTGYSLGDYDNYNSIVCNSAGYDADRASDDETDQIIQERVDSALLNYSNSTMTNDNVHDLVDIVRATNMLKVETWNRFYNPLKGSGGDTDIFITRVSPAQTTYMPSILFNGYTPAGGTDIVSTPYSQSFDYFSIPSFAACFASHTASTSYYGSLSYEIRAFYLSGFLETLSDSINLPVLEEYNAAVAQAEETAANATDNINITKADILLMYILIKRLAATDFLEWIYEQTNNGTIGAEITLSGSDIKSWANKEGIIKISSSNGDYYPFVGNTTYITEAIDNGESFTVVNLDGWSQSIISGGVLDQLDNTATVFEKSDDDQYITKLLTSSYIGTSAQETDHGGLQVGNTINIGVLSYIYANYFDSYTSSGGEYYWGFSNFDEYNDAWEAMRAFVGDSWEDVKDSLSDEVEEIIVGDSDDPVEITPGDGEDYFKYSVYFNGMFIFAGYEQYTASELRQRYIDGIEECFAQMTQGISNIYDDIEAIIASMPSQMMNCIAWADYMNASDSEAQYYTDPTSANVTITIGSSSSDDSSSTYVTNETDAEALGYNVSYDDDEITLSSSGTLTDSQISSLSSNSRLVRGVEGATATATITPAVYTISATIARISTLAANSGTSYPYYGIANGRLESGADRYAQLQAHTVDYTSIASGLSDLNTNRVQPTLVTVTQQQYGTLSDFLDILGNLGAMLGEIGASILSSAANAFSSVFFDSDSSSSTTSSSTASAATLFSWITGSASTSTTPTLNGRYTFDSITMTRTSAATASYDTSTSTITYDTSTSTASAIGLESWAQSFIVGSGYSFYSLLQSIGLVIVMLSLLIIAFRNFYAYTISNKGDDIINAQTQLKVVLPRSIIAIFMIGLPVTSDTGIGFQGGCYLLLQLLGSIISYVAQIFMGLNGTGVMAMWTSIDVSQLGSDIAAYILFFVACLVLAVMFVLGIVAVFLQSIMLAAFYFVGPIVWSFYVWPFSSPESVSKGSGEGVAGSASETANGFLAEWTRKMTFGSLTNGRVGNQAPAGWVAGYIGAAMLTIGWCLIFWVVSMVFLGTSGVLTSSTTANASTISTALAATAGTTSIFSNAWANVLFATFIAVLLFLIMFRSAVNMFKGVGFNSFNVARTVGRAAGQLVARQAKNKLNQPINNISEKANQKLFGKQLEAARARGDQKAIERISRNQDTFRNWTTLDGTDGNNGIGSQLRRVGDGLARHSQAIGQIASGDANAENQLLGYAERLGQAQDRMRRGWFDDANADNVVDGYSGIPWSSLAAAAGAGNVNAYQRLYDSLTDDQRAELQSAGLAPVGSAEALKGLASKLEAKRDEAGLFRHAAAQSDRNAANRDAAQLSGEMASLDMNKATAQSNADRAGNAVAALQSLQALPASERRDAYKTLDADTRRALGAYGLSSLSDADLGTALETARTSQQRQEERVNSLTAQQQAVAERYASISGSLSVSDMNSFEGSLVQRTAQQALEAIRDADNVHRGEVFNRLGTDMQNRLAALGVTASTLADNNIINRALTSAATLGDVAMTANEAAQRTQLEAGRLAANYALSMADATNIVRSQANAATRIAANCLQGSDGNYTVGDQTQYRNAVAQSGAALAEQYAAVAASTSTEAAHEMLVREQCAALGGNVISSTQRASIAALGGSASTEQLEQLEARNRADERAAGIADSIRSGATLSADDKAFYEAYQTMVSFEQANGSSTISDAANLVNNAVNNIRSLPSNAIDATAQSFVEAYDANHEATQSIVNDFAGNANLVGAVATSLVDNLGFNDASASTEARALAQQLNAAAHSGALTNLSDIEGIVSTVANSGSDPRIKSLASELTSMTRDGVTGNGVLASSVAHVAASERMEDTLKNCRAAAQNNVVELSNQYVRDAQASSMMSLGTTDPATAKALTSSVGDSKQANLLASFVVSGALPSSVITGAANGTQADLADFSRNWSNAMNAHKEQKALVGTQTHKVLGSLAASGASVDANALAKTNDVLTGGSVEQLRSTISDQRNALEESMDNLRQQARSNNSADSVKARQDMQATNNKLIALNKAENELKELEKELKQFEVTRGTAQAYNQANTILWNNKRHRG